MARMLSITILCCAPLAAIAGDDFRAIQLEQELRYMQQQLQEQSRLISELRMQLSRPPETPPAVPLPSPGLPVERPRPPAAAASAQWLDAARWRQVRTGMSELEVISTLGPPTAMRTEDGARVLLYTMEIGATAFLSGRVTLRDRAVTEVQQPMLR